VLHLHSLKADVKEFNFAADHTGQNQTIATNGPKDSSLVNSGKISIPVQFYDTGDLQYIHLGFVDRCLIRQRG
jgi:hypothetical protein